MSRDLDRVLAAVADADRLDDDPDHLEPGALPGSDYERVAQAVQDIENRTVIADGPALPSREDLEADKQREERDQREAEDKLAPRPDPNLNAWFKRLEDERQERVHKYRDDRVELQP